MFKKILTGITTAALALTIQIPAQAANNRIAGPDRYSTSLAIAQQYFPSAKTVFVATGKNFPDALAAGPWAAVRQAPIMLVGDELTTQQAAYLKGLKSPKITILGGSGVVSAKVEARLAQYGTVERIYGANRYETASKIALRFGKTGRLYLATGKNFADALAGGALAAQQAAPIMLTGPGMEQYASKVAQQVSAKETVVLGGPGAVPDASLAGLPSPKRIYGANRYETASKIFQTKPGTTAFLASGINFPDALSIVPAAGLRQMPLLLAQPSCSPIPPTVPVTFVGGQGALNDAATSQCPAATNTVVSALMTLAVKGRAPKTGYDRPVVFGQAWKDTDLNGCDTRNDILGRDLTNKTYKTGTNNCVVLSGVLNDPYSGGRINFVRGQNTSSAVQIDHVVALSDAWQKGAQQLTQDQREQLANDPLNLLAVDGPLNQQKSDGDAATWLPPNKAFRCDYVSRQIAVKKKYGLWVTETERNTMLTVLNNCSNPVLPNDATANSMKEQPQTRSEPSQPSGGSAAPIGKACPSNAPIKGNANSGIYHVPGGRYYDKTTPEACFATESDAQNAGYRRSKV
ncbi:cell wall-binding repeat-containing protein [Mobiluncus curtisii]|uniref:cell wall-binding repeat-containing protein n=1 Tax=Mobiluncus curtisii TaxID=2051 RepID=UPI0014703250|nr:DUF1524 domain-containing protein [Mobiluncus curtisii]MCV0020106.1 DUF1524 domain-containing protein [Mobiluncus curtisii]NMX12724.1 DUF1524 domain-containing protein [Mobiluncus curtisii]